MLKFSLKILTIYYSLILIFDFLTFNFLDFGQALSANPDRLFAAILAAFDHFISDSRRLAAFGTNKLHIGRVDGFWQGNDLALLPLLSRFLAFFGDIHALHHDPPVLGQRRQNLSGLGAVFPGYHQHIVAFNYLHI